MLFFVEYHLACFKGSVPVLDSENVVTDLTVLLYRLEEIVIFYCLFNFKVPLVLVLIVVPQIRICSHCPCLLYSGFTCIP